MVLRIGIAMLQGARHEHAQAVSTAASQLRVDVKNIELRVPSDLDGGIDALILPGGESTSMRLASRPKGLLAALFDWMDENPASPVLATCAGAILLCDPGQQRAPYVEAGLKRNDWGRQSSSFQADVKVSLDIIESPEVEVPVITDKHDHASLKVSFDEKSDDFPGVFIRAPRFTACNADAVAFLKDEVVGVLSGARLALTFHPELTNDHRFHRWLLHSASSEA